MGAVNFRQTPRVYSLLAIITSSSATTSAGPYSVLLDATILKSASTETWSERSDCTLLTFTMGLDPDHLSYFKGKLFTRGVSAIEEPLVCESRFAERKRMGEDEVRKKGVSVSVFEVQTPRSVRLSLLTSGDEELE